MPRQLLSEHSWRAPSFSYPPDYFRLLAQDDVTTQNGSSAYGGAFITGPASNPLSFLNGPAFRTTGQNTPYDFPDFAPMSKLDEGLPSWIGFGLEERLRWEGMVNQSFKLQRRRQLSVEPLALPDAD